MPVSRHCSKDWIKHCFWLMNFQLLICMLQKVVYIVNYCSVCFYAYCYGAVLRRRMPHHVLILSVCLSLCPVPPPREKTKRPTNTKLGRNGPWDTSTLWTNFKVKGSEVKVTAANCVVNFNISMFIVYCSHRVVDKTIDYYVLLRY